MTLKSWLVLLLGRLLRPLPEPAKRVLRVAGVKLGLIVLAGPQQAGPKDEYVNEETASVYRDAGQAYNERRLQDAISLVDAYDDRTSEQDLFDNNLFYARIVRVDALIADGRGREAVEALDRMEAIYGARWSTLMRRAKLGVFTGNVDAALQAVERAFFFMPVSRKNSSFLAEAGLQKVDLLVAAGRHEEARDFFVRTFPLDEKAGNLTDRHFASLRKTILNDRDLVWFKNLLLPSFAHDGYRAINSLFHYSIAARDLGHYEEALLAIQRRFVIGSRVVSFGEKRRPAKVNWSADARRALADLKADLSKAGIRFFLISGTLLGCIREGSILGHDKDIDVGVMQEVGFDQVRGALSGTGRFVLLPVITEKILRVKHSNGVMIDIFFHWEEDGKMFHEGQKTKWWNTPFGLSEVEFLGERFLVPSDPDRYLTENYGDWRTPVTEFETFCDTPNMIISDHNEMLWYYYRMLFDYYYSGSQVLFNKVWSAICRLSSPSVEMRKAVRYVEARMSYGNASEEGGI